MQIYVVEPGDTIDSIAISFGITPDSIIYNNQIPYPYSLTIGQALLLTTVLAPTSGSPPSIHAGGYAYPFISSWVLEQTLPYLSDLYIFSYGFTLSGKLIPPLWDDSWMISLAKAYGTAPILTLTPFDETGQFNNYLISSVINNDAARTRLIAETANLVTEKGFEGVDIDFEYILASDRVPFAEFVAEMRVAINALGYPVSVALAPKTSDTQAGLLYEGKDYALLGEAADYVLLMTYEWGYTYGPPMAVAPLNKVREVIEYALTKIPAAKINMGIPNYGYNWTLPFVKGTSKAQTIGNVEAAQLAIEQAVPIRFDMTAMSPYFRYFANSTEHEVWFEDVRSMDAKFSLLKEYSLRGASYWQIMQLFRANWLLLADRFTILKQTNAV